VVGATLTWQSAQALTAELEAAGTAAEALRGQLAEATASHAAAQGRLREAEGRCEGMQRELEARGLELAAEKEAHGSSEAAAEARLKSQQQVRRLCPGCNHVCIGGVCVGRNASAC
jgi:hypothetical protein